jgi:fucose permease
LLQLMHLGSLLFVSTAAVSVGLLGYAILGSWWLFLACAFIIGTGSGAIDGALNAYASRNFSPRHMTWLHGCYGVGASIGPALMTRAVANVGSWRTGYLELATLLGVLTVVFLLTQSAWGDTKRTGAVPEHRPAASLREALSDKRVLLGALTFFTYTGLEATLGQWNFTLNTEGRGAAETWAGSLSVLFWASLTAGRFFIGILVARLGAGRLLTFSLASAVVGSTIFAFPSLAASAVGLMLAGFGMATIYPLLMADTPGRVGTRMTDHAVGLQVSSATLGVIVMPSIAGVLGQYIGLAAIPPLAIALAIALILLHAAAARA